MESVETKQKINRCVGNIFDFGFIRDWLLKQNTKKSIFAGHIP